MEKTVIPKIKNDDTEHLKQVTEMTAAELDELVRSGRYGITILTKTDGIDTSERILPGEWRLCFITSRGKGGAERPITRVVLSHGDKRTGAIYREGMQRFGEEAGLTPDHSFNWRNIFNNSRFRLLEALVEVQNNSDLRTYLKTMPPMINSHPNIQWLRAMPTNSAMILALSPMELNQLQYLVEEVLCPRYTFEDLHHLRENNRAAKAAARGESYTIQPYVERAPRNSGGFKPRNDKSKVESTETQPKYNKRPVHQETHYSHNDGFPALKPDHERRQERRRKGDRLRDKSERHGAPRWR